jgi:hypothetical protein
MARTKSEKIFACAIVAGTSTATFSMSHDKYASIQVSITESCLAVASVPDECISLVANSYTEPAHGYVTGLKGTLAASIGCASTWLDECGAIACCVLTITEACHGLTEGERGQMTVTIGCASTTPAACVAICACRITITEACHCYIKGERGQFTTSACDLPAGICLATNYFVTNVTACTYDISSTRALAIACCADVAVTDAGTGCHTFTPNGALPSGVCAATNYFVICVTACTYRLASTRALAIAACPTSIAVTALNSPASHVFTPNGAIPTGSTACSFVIKIDDCTFKLATSKALAIAGTVDTISALNSPGATTFTPAAADCTSGTVTVRYSNCSGPCATYVVDAGIGLLAVPGVILAAGLCTIDAETGVVPYESVQVEVDVTDSQWIANIIMNAKD